MKTDVKGGSRNGTPVSDRGECVVVLCGSCITVWTETILLVMHSVQEEEGMNGMRHGLLIPLDMDPPLFVIYLRARCYLFVT
jgi:hypothetical protein